MTDDGVEGLAASYSVSAAEGPTMSTLASISTAMTVVQGVDTVRRLKLTGSLHAGEEAIGLFALHSIA